MQDLYTTLVSKGLFPLHEKLKHHNSVAIRQQLEQSQWWSPQQLAQWQLARLQQLLLQAQQHVPYYRELFAQRGFDPAGLQRLSQLADLPLLSKAEIRAAGDQLKADNAVGLARFNTGGSSGQPLIFYIGKQRVSHDVAAKWRATRWWDVDIGDKEIVLWGSPIELGAQDKLRLWRDRLLRTRLLPAFEMSDQKVRDYLQQIQRFKPRMLFGYPSVLAHLAQQAQTLGWPMDQLGIKVAFVTSEVLYDYQRRLIEQVFACPVANGYGGRDAGFIAHQCPQGQFHITAEDIIVEIIDPAGKVLPVGESGEIVVTHLATGDFPFIRYRTGDVGRLSSELCSCGRGLPVLAEVQGRSTDFVVAQDGTVMHGLALIYVVRNLPGVCEFKVVQLSRDQLEIYLVTNAEFSPLSEQTIISGMKQRLGAGVNVVLKQVNDIPAEASGKYRYIISHVAIT